jgi:hypothetical protein
VLILFALPAARGPRTRRFSWTSPSRPSLTFEICFGLHRIPTDILATEQPSSSGCGSSTTLPETACGARTEDLRGDMRGARDTTQVLEASCE